MLFSRYQGPYCEQFLCLANEPHCLPSDVLLGSDWILPCQPAFIDNYPFISDPTLEIVQAFPHPHIWQQFNGSSICLCARPLL